MASLNKVAPVCIRLTPDQKRRTEQAAGIVSRKRQEKIKPSSLLRELAMPQIDQILAAEDERKKERAA